MGLTINQRQEGKVRVLQITGEGTLANNHALRNLWLALLDCGIRNFIVDLTEFQLLGRREIKELDLYHLVVHHLFQGRLVFVDPQYQLSKVTTPYSFVTAQTEAQALDIIHSLGRALSCS